MLEQLFAPRSVAIVGAGREPDKLGYVILDNCIKSGFKGPIYPINPKADEILGLKCYANLRDIPGPVDLIVIVVPQRFVLGVMQDAAAKDVKGAVIITAGFREAGKEGVVAEEAVMKVAREAGIRVVGPNCLGLLDTFTPVDASFGPAMPSKGYIGFASQSGALLSAILDWASVSDIGFGKILSLGNKADIDEVDFIDALQDDDETRVIAAYIEGVTNGQKFIKTASAVTKKKPVLLFKSGTTSAGSRAVSSHTGTLAGSEASYVAAFKQSGVIRAASVSELFDLASAFAMQPLPKGRRIGIVTNAGGPGIIATDAAEKASLQVVAITPETIERMRPKLTPTTSYANPVDIIGDAKADRYAVAVEGVLNDPNVDGVVVILTPQTVTEPAETAQVIANLAKTATKPILASFIGGKRIEPALPILRAANVPNYLFPEGAIGAFAALANYAEWQKAPAEEPVAIKGDKAAVRKILDDAYAAGRTTLGAESMDIFEAYGFRIPKAVLATNAQEAGDLADKLGYPIVMKIVSPEILHKSDVGGVKVGLKTRAEVEATYTQIVSSAKRHVPNATIQGVSVQQMAPAGREIILGTTKDPQFGHLMMFGLGGIYVEVLKDVSFRVAPLTQSQAREMIGEIRAAKLLAGVRGEPPADVEAIVESLTRLSQLVTDFPEITELDINPLMVYAEGKGGIAVDGRIALEAPKK